jgi:hypothetical protein
MPRGLGRVTAARRMRRWELPSSVIQMPYVAPLLPVTEVLASLLLLYDLRSLKPIAGSPVARTGRRVLRLAGGAGLK